jgi:hypothetical protein
VGDLKFLVSLHKKVLEAAAGADVRTSIREMADLAEALSQDTSSLHPIDLKSVLFIRTALRTLLSALDERLNNLRHELVAVPVQRSEVLHPLSCQYSSHVPIQIWRPIISTVLSPSSFPL